MSTAHIAQCTDRPTFLVWVWFVGFGSGWLGLVWLGWIWFGSVWFGSVWFGSVWFGLFWSGLVWFGFGTIALMWLGSEHDLDHRLDNSRS